MLSKIGTLISTNLFGINVGKDKYGNIYYNSKNDKKRWVMYFKNNDASSVPPEWQSWLTKTTNDLPKDDIPKYDWQLEHEENQTGDTNLLDKKINNNILKKNTAYSAWTPENKEGSNN